jgi:hypothetical protein
MLAFREVHFGGVRNAAGSPGLCELAPPLLTGGRGFTIDNPTVADAGYSYGFSAYITKSTVGDSIAGQGKNGGWHALWWRALSQEVQYRPSWDTKRAASGLPGDFIAEPVEGLSPVLPVAQAQLHAVGGDPGDVLGNGSEDGLRALRPHGSDGAALEHPSTREASTRRRASRERGAGAK